MESVNEVQELFSVNNIRTMEVIDVESGKKLGFIKDLVVDCDNYKIISLIIPEEKMSLFGREGSVEIPWENIWKIGIDVILVKDVK
ncbi:YlmC/YmxH family sporulation protein [Hathewaya massiliensis]|uniref:YlmC/YmxH family sporulation protein n=1 Tax=Hathewaya massiliensis TaxID=1964382 RepID=UPI001158D705|nr:YlmC/YmxH family sporulation protein [Hathewaya massiliensis]